MPRPDQNRGTLPTQPKVENRKRHIVKKLANDGNQTVVKRGTYPILNAYRNSWPAQPSANAELSFAAVDIKVSQFKIRNQTSDGDECAADMPVLKAAQLNERIIVVLSMELSHRTRRRPWVWPGRSTCGYSKPKISQVPGSHRTSCPICTTCAHETRHRSLIVST